MWLALNCQSWRSWYLRAGRHGWASLLVAGGEPSAPVCLLDDLQHATEVAVLLDDCSNVSWLNKSDMVTDRTLVRHPLALFNEVWFGGQSHEVSLDNVARVLLTEEEWWLPRALVALMSLLVDLHGARGYRWGCWRTRWEAWWSERRRTVRRWRGVASATWWLVWAGSLLAWSTTEVAPGVQHVSYTVIAMAWQLATLNGPLGVPWVFEGYLHGRRRRRRQRNIGRIHGRRWIHGDDLGS